jgi:FMN phosphatase YigB (HAD superfamily)
MNVAFDIGNVLVSFDLNKFYHQCWKKVGARNSEFVFTEAFSKCLEDVEKSNYCGLTPMRVGIQSFLKKLGSSNNYSESDEALILKIWEEQVDINQQMVSWIKNLKSNDIKVAYLSNMGYEHFNILKNSELFKLADVLHISCEVGVAKPKKLFFQSFLMDNPQFSGSLYLDDLIENVKMASNYKFNAKVFALTDFKKPSELKNKQKELENILFSR